MLTYLDNTDCGGVGPNALVVVVVLVYCGK